MAPSLATMRAILEDCGIRLAADQYEKLWAYHRLLREADAELNLTRIRNFENMVLKHYVDSLLVLRFEELPSPLLDMGTGPGLPGIPLKIARPGTHIILAEPRGARADFLRHVCERLNLEGVEVHAGRISPRFGRRVRGVITRAVAAVPETMDAVAGCLEQGGKLILMKGPDCGEEMAEARATRSGSYRLAGDDAYEIPGTTHHRRLLVYERLDQPQVGGDEGEARVFQGPVKEVTSPSNPSFRLARDVLAGKGIRKHGRAVIAGARIVEEVLERFPENVEAWMTDAKGEPPPVDGVAWLKIEGSLYRELDVSGTKGPLLLARTPEMPEWRADEPWPDGCTLFVPFQDPENVGAVLRSAAAFGVSRVVLLKEAAHPFHPKAARAAGPALFQVPMMLGPSIQELETSGVPLVPLDAEGSDLDAEPWPIRFGLVPGVEGPGLPDRLRTSGAARRIPIAEGVESLNAATAVAVALYAWKRSR